MTVRVSLAAGGDSGNYSLSTPITTTATIDKANASITVTPYSVTFDGTAHTATGTATGVGGANLAAQLTLTGTTHTNAGDYPADAWSFSGGTNYNDASGTAHDVIGKATASVTLGSLAQTYDGTPRSATAVTTPPGLTVLLTYNGSGTAPTDAGSYTVVGTISDANYEGSSTGTLVISQATITITWSNPADIVYGTALSATQLNATANVPGSFLYTPAAGTVLGVADNQTLHVAFTPTDSTNYSSSSKDVLINVKPYELTISGVTANDKTYDATTTAVLNTGSAALVGVQGGDVGNVDGELRRVGRFREQGLRDLGRDGFRLLDQRLGGGQLHAGAADGHHRFHLQEASELHRSDGPFQQDV